jgi:hypothetical protein
MDEARLCLDYYLDSYLQDRAAAPPVASAACLAQRIVSSDGE